MPSLRPPASPGTDGCATPRPPAPPASCPSPLALITRERSQIFKHPSFLQEFLCWVLWAFYNRTNHSLDEILGILSQDNHRQIASPLLA